MIRRYSSFSFYSAFPFLRLHILAPIFSNSPFSCRWRKAAARRVTNTRIRATMKAPESAPVAEWTRLASERKRA